MGKLFEVNNSIKGIISIKHKNSSFNRTIANEYIEKDYINFITSIRNGGANISLYVPKIYIELYLIFLSILALEREEVDFEFRGRLIDTGFNEFPSLYLSFLYSDIGNVEHNKKITISPTFDMFYNLFVYGNFRQTENFIRLLVKPIN